MPDFRDDLYRRYVSTYKGRQGGWSPAALDLFARWCDHRYAPLLRPLPPTARILEVGCGPGHLLAYLHRRGWTGARGIDRSPEQVEIARAQGLPVDEADAFDFLRSHPAAFDAILAVDVLEHFTRQEVLDLLPLLHDALAEGGLLLVQTANGAGLFPGQVIHGDFTHLTIFTPQSLAQVLALYGFERFDFHETGPAPLGLRGRLSVLAWSAVRAAANAVRQVEAGKRQDVWTETFICRAWRAPGPTG